MNTGKICESEKPLLSRLLKAKYSAGESVPDLDIISEAMGHMYVLPPSSLDTVLTGFLGLRAQILRLFPSHTSSGR